MRVITLRFTPGKRSARASRGAFSRKRDYDAVVPHHLVRDYDEEYSRTAHARAIRPLLREWTAFLTAGRPFVAVPGPAWRFGAMPFDAHFDEDYLFRFCSIGEAARFKARYKKRRK